MISLCEMNIIYVMSPCLTLLDKILTSIIPDPIHVQIILISEIKFYSLYHSWCLHLSSLSFLSFEHRPELDESEQLFIYGVLIFFSSAVTHIFK